MEGMHSPTSHSFSEPKSDNVIEVVDREDSPLADLNHLSTAEEWDQDPYQYTQTIFEEQQVEEESETDINLREEAHECRLKIKLPLLKKKPVEGLEVSQQESQETKKTKERKRKHRNDSVQTPSKSVRLDKSESRHKESDNKSNSDNGDDISVVARRPRGRPPKPREPVVPASSFSVAVYVEVAMHPVLQRGKTKCGDKIVKQDPKTCGPFTLTHATKWRAFVKELADLTNVEKENIPFESMVWLMGSKKSLLLTNKAGFKAMQHQIKGAKDPNAVVIIIYLPPLASRQVRLEMKEKDESKDDSILNANTTAWGKKQSLNKQLAPVVEKLQD
ncbi:hypothetical protein C0992_006118 [Termitomyces sp. T32_za158]|nr:hypothetical protein C0992_006118 [Termitomyces sp. T32_za158]